MEDGLGEGTNYQPTFEVKVLILVLMEDGLGVMFLTVSGALALSLNPCFNGRWSRRGSVHLEEGAPELS